MSSNKFEDYLRKVTSKVKYRDAHGMIKQELINHLQELKQSFLNKETVEDEAEDKAIQEMGNPYTLGEKLNQVHKPKIDWFLIVLFVMFGCISFLPLINGAPEVSGLIERQVIWYVFAILVIICFLFFDYRKLQNSWMFFYLSGLVLHLYTYLFGIEANGAKEWVPFLGFTFHVPMITLFLFILAWAGIFIKIKMFDSSIKKGMLFLLFWTPFFIYQTLPNFMMGNIYLICIVAMFGFSNINRKLAIKSVVANLIAFVFFIGVILSSPFREHLFVRISTFINPNSNDAGFLYQRITEVITQAGWFGNGLSHDLKTPVFEPVHTDFVFPNLVYSLGWLFGIVLCIILLLFIIRTMTNAFKTNDLYGRLLVIGCSTLFIVPTCWNIFMGLGLVPIIPAPIPFISYGGGTLLINSATLGLILNIYRRKDIVEPTVLIK